MSSPDSSDPPSPRTIQKRDHSDPFSTSVIVVDATFRGPPPSSPQSHLMPERTWWRWCTRLVPAPNYAPESRTTVNRKCPGRSARWSTHSSQHTSQLTASPLQMSMERCSDRSYNRKCHLHWLGLTVISYTRIAMPRHTPSRTLTEQTLFRPRPMVCWVSRGFLVRYYTSGGTLSFELSKVEIDPALRGRRSGWIRPDEACVHSQQGRRLIGKMPSLVMVGAITEQAASSFDESGDAFHNHEFVRHAKSLGLAEWAVVQGPRGLALRIGWRDWSSLREYCTAEHLRRPKWY